jgi:hypothetical protein
MGVEWLNSSISTPTLPLPLQGGGNNTALLGSVAELLLFLLRLLLEFAGRTRLTFHHHLRRPT